jgi:cytochrome c oxidase subunit 3
MASSSKHHHPYHLVDPSPWPFAISASVFVLAVGFLLTIRSIPVFGMHIGPVIWALGGLSVLTIAALWWRDVAIEATYKGDHTHAVQVSHRYGMILFIASEVMFFVAWFWAFFDGSFFPNEAIQFQRAEFTGGQWPPKNILPLDPWQWPFLNTLILLASGTTVTWAHHALMHNDRPNLKKALWLTLALGVAFTAIQIYEYIHASFPFAGNIYGSAFYMATGFHGAHVLIGTIFLAVCLFRVYRNHFTPKQHLGFEFAAWYWHFVDVVWLFLFAFIYLSLGDYFNPSILPKAVS